MTYPVIVDNFRKKVFFMPKLRNLHVELATISDRD